MAEVIVTKSGDTIYFRPSIQQGSEQLSEYLNLLVNRAATVQRATKELEAKTLAAIATLEDAAAQVDGQEHGQRDCTRTEGILRTQGEIG